VRVAYCTRPGISKKQGMCTVPHCSVILVRQNLADKIKTTHSSQGLKACTYIGWEYYYL